MTIPLTLLAIVAVALLTAVRRSGSRRRRRTPGYVLGAKSAFYLQSPAERQACAAALLAAVEHADEPVRDEGLLGTVFGVVEVRD